MLGITRHHQYHKHFITSRNYSQQDTSSAVKTKKIHTLQVNGTESSSTTVVEVVVEIVQVAVAVLVVV